MMSHVTPMNESSHTYESAMSQLQMSHITRMSESRLHKETLCVLTRIDESFTACNCISVPIHMETRHIDASRSKSISVPAHIDASCETCESISVHTHIRPPL